MGSRAEVAEDCHPGMKGTAGSILIFASVRSQMRFGAQYAKALLTHCLHSNEVKVNSQEERENKILSIIQLDGESSIADLARKTGLRQRTVQECIGRLVERKTIQRVVMIDMGRLGFTHYLIYLKEIEGDVNAYDRFLESLDDERQVTAVLAMSGRFELVVNLMARSPNEFRSIWDRIRLSAPSFSQLVTVRPSYHLFGRRYPETGDAESTRSLSYRPLEEVKADVSEDDLPLLSAYSRFSSLVEVSRALGIRESTISYRIKRLKQQGIILRVVYINYGREQEKTTRHLIRLGRPAKDIEERLYRFCLFTPSVMFLSSSVGEWDYEVQVSSRNLLEAEKAKRLLYESFPGEIRGIDSIVRTKSIKAITFPFYPPKRE